MGLVAFNVVPVAIAFFGAAIVLLLVRSLSLREAYDAIEWPILIMLGALIPVSDALRTTGGTDLIAAWLSHAASALPPMGSLALLLAAAMAVTPFSTMQRQFSSWRLLQRALPAGSAITPIPSSWRLPLGRRATSSRQSVINATRW
jgi:hypothetical protein